MAPARLATGVGALSLALIVGALGFQYIGGYAPCDVCHWQRWPHMGSAALGLIGGAFIQSGRIERKWESLLASTALALVAAAGFLGVYHAGVEWHLWGGPEHCSGPSVVFRGLEGLGKDPAVRCDQAAWRFLGLSLAGYNAIISLGTAAAGALLLRTKR